MVQDVTRLLERTWNVCQGLQEDACYEMQSKGKQGTEGIWWAATTDFELLL